jgi:NADPH oxidase
MFLTSSTSNLEVDIIEIRFTKPSMTYKPGQWLFLNVPCVSRLQWHPFTITSCPFDPYISIHVRQAGDFTRALGDVLGAGRTQGLDKSIDCVPHFEQKMPELRIDGPYGSSAEDILNNKIAVVIGAGIGTTPWAAILKNI